MLMRLCNMIVDLLDLFRPSYACDLRKIMAVWQSFLLSKVIFVPNKHGSA